MSAGSCPQHIRQRPTCTVTLSSAPAGSPPDFRSKLRTASWAVGAASLLLPAVMLLWMLHDFEQSTAGQVYRCGLPVLGIWALAIAVGALLSLVASVLNGLAWRRDRSGRTAWRFGEWALVTLPALAAALLCLAL